MPLPILANVYQVRLNWTNPNAPRDASNNLYFLDIPGTQTPVNLNTDINASVTASMWAVVSTSAVVNRLTVTPLDGVTAGAVFSTGSPVKWQASGGTDPILQGAAVISVKSTHRGPAGRGRIYLPWIGEANQTNGILVGSGYTGLQAAWDTFAAAMIAAGWAPVAVSSKLGQANQATYTVRANLLTQRRRARR